MGYATGSCSSICFLYCTCSETEFWPMNLPDIKQNCQLVSLFFRLLVWVNSLVQTRQQVIFISRSQRWIVSFLGQVGLTCCCSELWVTFVQTSTATRQRLSGHIVVMTLLSWLEVCTYIKNSQYCCRNLGFVLFMNEVLLRNCRGTNSY